MKAMPPNTHVTDDIRTLAHDDLLRAVAISNRNLRQAYQLQGTMLKNGDHLRKLVDNTEQSMYLCSNAELRPYIETLSTLLVFLTDAKLSRDAVLFRFMLNCDLDDLCLDANAAEMLFPELFFGNVGTQTRTHVLHNVTHGIGNCVSFVLYDYLNGKPYVHSTPIEYSINKTAHRKLKRYREAQLPRVMRQLQLHSNGIGWLDDENDVGGDAGFRNLFRHTGSEYDDDSGSDSGSSDSSGGRNSHGRSSGSSSSDNGHGSNSRSNSSGARDSVVSTRRASSAPPASTRSHGVASFAASSSARDAPSVPSSASSMSSTFAAAMAALPALWGGSGVSDKDSNKVGSGSVGSTDGAAEALDDIVDVYSNYSSIPTEAQEYGPIDVDADSLVSTASAVPPPSIRSNRSAASTASSKLHDMDQLSAILSAHSTANSHASTTSFESVPAPALLPCHHCQDIKTDPNYTTVFMDKKNTPVRVMFCNADCMECWEI